MGVRRLVWMFVIVFLCVGHANAQKDVLRLSKVKQTKLHSPEYKVTRTPSSPQIAKGTQQWLELSVLYQTSPTWLDQLTVNFFVLLNDSESTPPYKMLTLSTTYSMISKGKHIAAAYIPPVVLARYGAPRDVYVEFSTTVAARVVGVATEETPPRWKPLPPVSDLLFNRLQTPFAWLNSDDYELITPSAK